MEKDKILKYLCLITLFIFCIAMSYVVNPPDYDLWSRLIVGKSILETGIILKQDFLSYTPTHFWYDHEWGAGLIFYTVLKHFSDIGLVILKGILIFSTLFFILKTIELRKVKTTSAYNILFYIFIFISFYVVLSATIRCHLFTFLLFTIWIYWLERVRLGEKKWLYIMPLSMIFWCNIHGGCISGIGLLIIYIMGEVLNKKPVKDYLLSLGLSCAATFINPYGHKYVLFLLKATTMPRPLITEWKSTFHSKYMFNYLKFKFFMLLMLLTIFIKNIKEKFDYAKIDKTKVLLLLITLFLSIKHVKHQPFFVITASIFLYNDFYTLYNSALTKIREKLNINSELFMKYFVSLKEIFVYGLIFLICTVTFATTKPVINIAQTKYPIYSVEFVRINNLKGNLFVGFNYGAYAGYKLYPNNKTAIDGRYEEVYNIDLINEVRNLYLVKTKNWDKVIKENKPNIIIIEKDYPIYKKLLTTSKWSMIFDSKDFATFVPTNKVKSKYKYPAFKDEYYNTTKFNTNIDFKKD